MKLWYTVLTFLFIIALVIGGCAKPAPAPAPTPAPTPAPSEEPVKNFVFMGTPGGKQYNFSAAISEILNRHSSIRAEIQVVPPAAEKFKMLREGTGHAIIWSATEPLFAYNGQQDYPPTQMRCLTSSGFPSTGFAAVMTTPATGVKKFSDLKGKRYLAGWSGQAWYNIYSEALLKVNNMTKDDLKYVLFGESLEAFREVKEGRADAILYIVGSAARDLAETVGLFVIPLSPAEQKAVNDALPAWAPITLPKGHQGANADTPVLGADLGLWFSPALTDISAYTVVKTLYENIDEFHSAQAAAKGFTLENALTVWVMPYHPGAIQYFKEMGIWGPEHDKKQEELLKADANLHK